MPIGSRSVMTCNRLWSRTRPGSGAGTLPDGAALSSSVDPSPAVAAADANRLGRTGRGFKDRARLMQTCRGRALMFLPEDVILTSPWLVWSLRRIG